MNYVSLFFLPEALEVCDRELQCALTKESNRRQPFGLETGELGALLDFSAELYFLGYT